MFCVFGIVFKKFLPVLGFQIYQHYLFLLYSFLSIKIPSV